LRTCALVSHIENQSFSSLHLDSLFRLHVAVMYVREGLWTLLVIVWHERAGQVTAVTSFKRNMKLLQSLLLLSSFIEEM